MKRLRKPKLKDGELHMYEETHWRVDVPVTHWMALPLPFNARVQPLP